MFNKINEFIDDLGTRNLFEDDELAKIADETREIINNVNPYSLKYSNDLRTQIHDQMDSLKNSIDVSIQDMPRRKLQIAPVPEEMVEEEIAA